MADVLLNSSPLALGASPVRIHYRDIGDGPPLVILHGGWGYDAYPFDRQLAALAPRHRIVIPDRTGYGGSGALDSLPTDFHPRAADETRALIDALGLARPILWGHSDGAIVALLVALAAPDSIAGAIVEATHYFKHKPASRAFFEGVAARPRSTFLEVHSRTWLRIVDEAVPGEDFYGGRLSELLLPVLVIHGTHDPRTEPGELETLRRALERRAAAVAPPAPRQGPPTLVLNACEQRREAVRHFQILEQGGHSPHSEQATSTQVTEAALGFLTDVAQTFSSAEALTKAISPTNPQ